MTIAGKTGTTSNNHDRYFVGYTPYYVAAVWTGYLQPENISYSGNPAITMWKKVMQPLHDDLPNKDFDKPSEGLTTVTVCADSGLLCSEACAADCRGSRAVSVVIAKGTEPKETCTMHTFTNFCSAGGCLATETCPMESVVQVGILNHIREDYGPEIVAEDDLYTIGGQEKALGLRPVIAEDGTEVYPEVIGCPVHAAGGGTDLPIVVDPSDPNYVPGLPEGGDFPPAEPVQPNAPQAPVEPADPSGTEDWWNDLWSDPA
jgi:penicillin-binding protein 1A